ncbi:MAG: hypothetical protein ACRDZO_11120 [Egibacteraceae bacterium]
MIHRCDLDRLQQPSQLRWIANSLGLQSDAASRQWAVARAVHCLRTRFEAEPAHMATRYPTYLALRREGRSLAKQALVIRDRLDEYAARSAGAAQERYLRQALGWNGTRDDLRDALAEARARLLEQARVTPFVSDTRYTCYEQFRKGLRTTAYRILADGRPLARVDIAGPAATGLRHSVRERLAGQLGGSQRLRWVVDTCEGLTPEEIAEADTARLREPVEAFVVYQAVDVVMRRWPDLGGEVPRPCRSERERHVRDWLRHHGYDQQVSPADREIIVRALVDDLGGPTGDRERVVRLYWEHAWFRYWIDPNRAELDRRLEECRRAVRRHCPELGKDSHVDTVAARMAGEPASDTARRQHHAGLRRSVRASAVTSELHLLRRTHPSLTMIAPA